MKNRIIFWILANIPCGRLAPYLLGLAIGRPPVGTTRTHQAKKIGFGIVEIYKGEPVSCKDYGGV